MRTPFRQSHGLSWALSLAGLLVAGTGAGWSALPSFPADAGASSPLAFRTGENGEFQFDTGVLRGKARAGGRSLGLSSVVHAPSGKVLDRSNGLFGHYRVFTKGKRYGGGAWDWPSVAKLRGDGALRVDWPSAEDRPFSMTAIYRFVGPSALNVETIVRAQNDLPGFEVFLASYLGPAFTNSSVWARPSQEPNGQPSFLAADQAAGDWQMFPRDDAGVALIQDGRWKLEPNPVNWTVRSQFALPLACRRAPADGVSILFMSPPSDCYTIATPHQAEGHYSLYLALFGLDVPAGQTVRAQAHLEVVPASAESEAVPRYQDYLRGFGPNSNSRSR